MLTIHITDITHEGTTMDIDERTADTVTDDREDASQVYSPADGNPLLRQIVTPEPVPPADEEWCEDCAIDEHAEAGMPRAVRSRTWEEEMLPEDWEPSWGDPPEREVTYLECGHVIVR